MIFLIGASATPSLSKIPGWAAVVAIAAVMVAPAIGVLVGRGKIGGRNSYGRRRKGSSRENSHEGSINKVLDQIPVQPNASGDSIVRSWIMVALVGGLLILCAVAFTLKDGTIRSMLLGGLVSSVGSAIAFYFSAQSQSDLLNATQGMSSVPALTGLLVTEAKSVMATTSLQLVLDDPPGTNVQRQSPIAKCQMPNAGTSVRSGTAVVVMTGPPPVAH